MIKKQIALSNEKSPLAPLLEQDYFKELYLETLLKNNPEYTQSLKFIIETLKKLSEQETIDKIIRKTSEALPKLKLQKDEINTLFNLVYILTKDHSASFKRYAPPKLHDYLFVIFFHISLPKLITA